MYSLYEERHTERQTDRQTETETETDRDRESIHLKVVDTSVKRNGYSLTINAEKSQQQKPAKQTIKRY